MVERRASLWLEENILYNKQVMEMAYKRTAPRGQYALNIAVFYMA
ncbi:MAG: hypothetical protein ACREBJ_03065 [Nitrosotalea sp.]